MAEFDVGPMTHSDLPGVSRVLEETELFPPDYLADMTAAYLAGQSTEIWLVARKDEAVAGFGMTDPEAMTDGTWNMRALAVAPPHQGSGAGAAIVAATEEAVAGMQGRLLIVDTSGTEAFAGARAFYLRCGYSEEARIRDFWGPGDDKVTFRKAL